MGGVDGGRGREEKFFVAIAGCLVLGGSNGEDKEVGLSVSAILVDHGGICVEIDIRCLDGLVGGLGIRRVYLAELRLGEIMM